MHVIATAGHVDHGKSTLVRALTGMEPDRWAEERRRGMTIDLGFAWTPLDGELLAFVDVPGHQRFIGNMLAGLGPAPAVLVVVAADEGWRRQSGEHLAAVHALGLRHGLLAVTRSDLADPAAAMSQARERIAATSLGDVEAVAVSGVTGAGLTQLRAALSRLVARLPAPTTGGRVRMWIDRAFTIRGSGTVVTGTLGAGTLRVGQELLLGAEPVRIRGLHQAGVATETATAVARVAVNLRSVAPDAIGRGDVLLTPGAWRLSSTLDVRLSVVEPGASAELPAELMLHVGSAAVPVRVRRLGDDLARLQLRGPALPLQIGDRAILRDPGAQSVAAGVLVLDIDPPGLRRRGAAAARAQELAAAGGQPDIEAQIARRGAVRRSDLEALGMAVPDDVAAVRVGDWLVDAQQWSRWAALLVTAVDAHATALEPGRPAAAAAHDVGLPDPSLTAALADHAGLELRAGRVQRPGVVASLGPAEEALRRLELQLADSPFLAPERGALAESGLGPRELAVAVSTGRLIRLADDIVLLPTGPVLAMRALAGLPQPFTTSQARQALGTTRRVAIPLLEHLDARGWTDRIDDGHRRVRR